MPDLPSRSAIAWQPNGNVGILTGRLVDIDSLQPITSATVRLDSLRRTTGADGRFRFDSVSAGTHHLEIRRLGFPTEETQLDLAAAHGLDVLAALAFRPIVLDACGFAKIEVHKPWWKWW